MSRKSEPRGGRAALAAAARSMAEKPGLLAGYLGSGILLYASSIGLVATAVYLITRASQRPAILTLGVLMAGTRYFAISRAGARYLERILSHSLVLSSLSRVRVMAFRALVPRFPQEASALSSGELLGSLTRSIDDLQDLFIRLVAPIALAVATAILALALGSFIELRAGILLFALIAVFPIGGAAVLGGAGAAQAAGEENARAALERKGGDLLRARDELFLMGTLEDHLADADNASMRLEEHSRSRLARQAHLGFLANLAAQAAFTFSTWFALQAIQAHTMRAVLVGIMPLAAQAALEAVAVVASGTATGPAQLASVAKLPLGNEGADAGETTGSPVLGFVFDRVVVRRSEQRPLGPFSFTIPPGSATALVGASGSGKTSLAYAALGYLIPASGSITLSGADAPAPRPRIGFVPESPAVLETTLRSNLALAAPSATDAEMQEALSAAALGHLAEGKGLEALLGPGGRELSGGERERLAIARLLLADYSTVILDEPTASLDRPTAEQVLSTLLRVFRGRTLVVITHQEYLLSHFQQVIRLEALKGG